MDNNLFQIASSHHRWEEYAILRSKIARRKAQAKLSLDEGGSALQRSRTSNIEAPCAAPKSYIFFVMSDWDIPQSLHNADCICKERVRIFQFSIIYSWFFTIFCYMVPALFYASLFLCFSSDHSSWLLDVWFILTFCKINMYSL